jgi:hypothetical protein
VPEHEEPTIMRRFVVGVWIGQGAGLDHCGGSPNTNLPSPASIPPPSPGFFGQKTKGIRASSRADLTFRRVGDSESNTTLGHRPEGRIPDPQMLDLGHQYLIWDPVASKHYSISTRLPVRSCGARTTELHRQTLKQTSALEQLLPQGGFACVGYLRVDVQVRRLQNGGQLVGAVRCEPQAARSRPFFFRRVSGKVTRLVSKVGFNGATADLEGDDLEHPNSGHRDHWGGQIGTQASDLVIRDNVGDSFDHDAPATVLSHFGLISLKRHG